MAQRFNLWDLNKSPDFWKSKFKPNELIRVMAHVASILSQRKDARLLERYDINKLSEHTPGACYIWVPIELDEPKYLGDGELFPWEYEIDKNWLYIDCIYDKHVDPEINLQNGIDFYFVQGSGKLLTAKKIENSKGYCPKLYISKGWYAEYRIYKEIGHFLNYVKPDSPAYRDSVDPILAILFEGPTLKNLIAVLNVLVGLPVAKYEGEKILSILKGIIVTDKYQYDIGGVHTKCKIGDTLYRFQPLTDAVVVHTNQNDPSWWKYMPTDMFRDLVPGTQISEGLRDFLFENYFSEGIIRTEFRQDRLGSRNIDINTDIYNLVGKTKPIRADILYAQTYHVGVTVDPDGDVLDPRNSGKWNPVLYINSCYGRYGGANLGEYGGQFAKDATLIGHGKIYRHLIPHSENNMSLYAYEYTTNEIYSTSIESGKLELKNGTVTTFSYFNTKPILRVKSGNYYYGSGYKVARVKDLYTEIHPSPFKAKYDDRYVILEGNNILSSNSTKDTKVNTPEAHKEWTNIDDFYTKKRSKLNRLTLRDGLWHIRSKDHDAMYEFWRWSPYYIEVVDPTWYQEVLTEPWFELVHIRMESKEGKPLWPGTQSYRVPGSLIRSGGTEETNSLTEFLPDVLSVGLEGPGTSGQFSSINSIGKFTQDEIANLGIAASTIYEYNNLCNWERSNITVDTESKKFLVGNVSEEGFLIGPPLGIDVGVIPKKIVPTAIVEIPAEDPKVYFELYYSVFENGQWSSWHSISNNGKEIRDPDTNNPIYFTGKVRFKIYLHKNANLEYNPALLRYRVQIKA